jgi:hypothetical protein
MRAGVCNIGGTSDQDTPYGTAATLDYTAPAQSR